MKQLDIERWCNDANSGSGSKAFYELSVIGVIDLLTH
jgi:hypothetical protein